MSWDPLAVFKNTKTDYSDRRDELKAIYIIRPLIPNQDSIIRGATDLPSCQNTIAAVNTPKNIIAHE
jgi:hypothetical protein